jgi:hypothetical protein
MFKTSLYLQNGVFRSMDKTNQRVIINSEYKVLQLHLIVSCISTQISYKPNLLIKALTLQQFSHLPFPTTLHFSKKKFVNKPNLIIFQHSDFKIFIEI